MRSRTFDLSRRALVMGVLNVTPDSFSDGGQFIDLDAAVAHARQLASEGADIIDIGGESTRPGAEPVSEAEEMRRVLPVIERLAESARCSVLSAQSEEAESARCSVLGAQSSLLTADCSLLTTQSAEGAQLSPSTEHRAPSTFPALSIDTMKPAVARAALERGAEIVNDVTGLRDPEMRETVRASGAAAIAMHMQGSPRDMQRAPHYDDLLGEIRECFRQTFQACIRSQIDPMHLAFDPGIGFGKTLAHNLELLRNLDSMRVGGRPLVLGASRKSFIGKAIGSSDPADRAWPTVALTSYGRGRGANVFRVHEVRRNAEALRMTEAILDLERAA